VRQRTGSTSARNIRTEDFEKELTDTRLNMGQTKLTAHLPTVDIEITRHELPEQNAQALTIHITATPSFDDPAQWLLKTALFSIAPPFSIWIDFMQVWQRTWFPVWQPWLPTDSPPVRWLKEPE